MHTILLPGFRPFVGRTANVSGDIARALDGLTLDDLVVSGLVLPVEWGFPEEILIAQISEFERQGRSLLAILSLGEGAGDRVRVEERARNGRRPGQKDEGGRTPEQIGREIVPGGPDEHASPLAPVLLNALEMAAIPCAVSQNAGQFLCEETLYTTLRLTEGRGVPAGFLHLPPYPHKDRDQSEPDNQAHMRTLEQAVKTAVKGIIAWKDQSV